MMMKTNIRRRVIFVKKKQKTVTTLEKKKAMSDEMNRVMIKFIVQTFMIIVS